MCLQRCRERRATDYRKWRAAVRRYSASVRKLNEKGIGKMTNMNVGLDALDILNQSDEGSNAEYAKFSSGTTYKVKVLSTADILAFFNYGIYGKVYSFVAKNPSVKSKKGYPVENYTPFDLAWKYHQDKTEEFGDHHSTEASKFKPKQRFAMGFIDLDSGEPIIIDVSKNQAQAIMGSINKNEKKIDKKPFELSKEGKGTSTVVSLMPEDLEDLTDKQQKNFENAPEEFDTSLFEGLNYEAEEDEQLLRLQQAGFDITLIGYSQDDVKKDGEEEKVESVKNDGEPDLPF